MIKAIDLRFNQIKLINESRNVSYPAAARSFQVVICCNPNYKKLQEGGQLLISLKNNRINCLKDGNYTTDKCFS